MIRVSSTTVWNQNKQALVAGLRWLPAPAMQARRRYGVLKRLAESLDAPGFVKLRLAANAVAWGFDDFDQEIEVDDRPKKCYSLAAGFARYTNKTNAILYWRVRAGSATNKVALVVLEHGLPVMDEIMADEQAVQILERYTKRGDKAEPYWLVSNDSHFVGVDEVLKDEVAFCKVALKEQNRIGQIPADYFTLGLVFGGLLVSALAFFGYEHYRATEEARARAALIASSDETQAYANMLKARMLNIGMRSTSMLEVLNQLYQQPFVVAGWALKEVRCATNVCQFSYVSKGGTMDNLLQTMGQDSSAQLVGEPRIDNITFRREMPVKPTALATVQELLPIKQLKPSLIREADLWNDAGLKTTVDLTGARWPEGFRTVKAGDQVYRHAVSLSAGPLMVEEFLGNYQQSVYWDSMVLKLSDSLGGALVSIELKGAFYGH